MSPLGIVIGILNIACGLLVILLCLPLLRGQVKRNPLYGMRFRRAFESDEAWYAINRYGARQTIGWSVPIIIIGVVCLGAPLGSDDVVATILLASTPLVLLIPALTTYRFARRLPEGERRGAA